MKTNDSELNVYGAVDKAVTGKKKWVKPSVEIISKDTVNVGTARYYAEGYITPYGDVGAS